MAIEILETVNIPSFAHLLNLVVQNSIKKSIAETIEKVKTIVQHFTKSSAASQKLEDMQKTLGFPIQKLKQDVKTRWNSTFEMLRRILETKEPLLSCIGMPQFES